MRKRWDSACYRELGAELRKRRQRAGLTEAELGRLLGWSASKVARCEFGQVGLSTVDVITYLAFCGVHGKQSAELRKMCREAELRLSHWLSPHEPGWTDSGRSLIYHEATAIVSTSYEPEIVPGLLQTEAYIRAVALERWPNRDPEQPVRIRKERQRILHLPDPGRFNFYLHENALRLAVGDAAVMHEQLLSLLLIGGLPHVTVRVVAGAAVFGGPFRLFEYTNHLPLVYLDGPFGGLFLEDGDYVEAYRGLLSAVADVALSEGESREYLAALANDHDRERADLDVHEHVEEK